ncbi:acetylglutamate kinase [Aquibacillus koreensis]|uniref:Acetylglutamate kinase n=1 Tax=Aquibacillus koreensis TaxID=279446 RepID=A0A9X4AI95_9BACI|nr:acetylglutamate kinase [Aquibacillus koreensis]MCT2538134.1 acetylglutamate kinase [Aquibacillus koreensis]MDC3420922.1 acetylglutamate kinase [Aquibacillus koreensis]
MNYVVIKCGGSVFEDLPTSFYKNIADLHQSGEWQPIIVHGGGPLISSLLTQMGVQTTFINGLRVTTNEVLDVVEMALSGSMNKQIVRNLMKENGKAYGISGVDGTLLKATPTDKADQLGFVGEVSEVNTSLIEQISSQGYIPVISPIGIDDEGQRYNINADMAASSIAQALGAKLCFISDIPGICVEEDGQKQTLHQVGKEKIEQLISSKVIYGGMIPKVQSALKALAHRVPEVSIVNGLEANSLVDFMDGKNVGTRISLDKEMPYV